jgi:hypothetical protein
MMYNRGKAALVRSYRMKKVIRILILLLVSFVGGIDCGLMREGLFL